MDWLQIKFDLALWSGVSEDALHIYAALGLQLLSAALLRRSLADPIPWLIVLVFLLGNEYADIRQPGEEFQAWQIRSGIHDIINTMLAPTVLLIVARFYPRLLTGKGKRR